MSITNSIDTSIFDYYEPRVQSRLLSLLDDFFKIKVRTGVVDQTAYNDRAIRELMTKSDSTDESVKFRTLTITTLKNDLINKAFENYEVMSKLLKIPNLVEFLGNRASQFKKFFETKILYSNLHSYTYNRSLYESLFNRHDYFQVRDALGLFQQKGFFNKIGNKILILKDEDKSSALAMSNTELFALDVEFLLGMPFKEGDDFPYETFKDICQAGKSRNFAKLFSRPDFDKWYPIGSKERNLISNIALKTYQANKESFFEYFKNYSDGGIFLSKLDSDTAVHFKKAFLESTKSESNINLVASVFSIPDLANWLGNDLDKFKESFFDIKTQSNDLYALVLLFSRNDLRKIFGEKLDEIILQVIEADSAGNSTEAIATNDDLLLSLKPESLNLIFVKALSKTDNRFDHAATLINSKNFKTLLDRSQYSVQDFIDAASPKRYYILRLLKEKGYVPQDSSESTEAKSAANDDETIQTKKAAIDIKTEDDLLEDYFKNHSSTLLRMQYRQRTSIPNLGDFVTSYKIDEKFLKTVRLEELDSKIIDKFGSFLDTAFRSSLPSIKNEKLKELKTEFLAFFPKEVRAKLQVGFKCPLPS